LFSRADCFHAATPAILLLGDFNAHSSLWGCSKTDVRGKLVGDLLEHNLSLLNDGSYTYLHPATGSSSAIDLSMATPSLYLDFSWLVIAYGVAQKLMFVESWSVISLNITCLC